MSTLNWGDLIKEAGESGNYDPLPDGDYDVVVVEATHKMTQSGKTMFSVKAQVEGGAHNKRLVWDNLVVSPDSPLALGIFFKKMHALGVPRDYFLQQPAPTNAQIEQIISGKRFRAQVGTRTWNGSKKNEIKNYYPNVKANFCKDLPQLPPHQRQHLLLHQRQHLLLLFAPF